LAAECRNYSGMTLGIMGGTFDPIHFGHLILAEQAREQLALDKVVFVTAADPPHKSGLQVADARHRHTMTCLAIKGNEWFEASTIEIERGGISYTVDTLRHLHQMLGPETDLHLLIGADEAQEFMTWREPYKILEMANIVVANRPGCEVEEALGCLPADVAACAKRLRMPGVDISSTDIRDRVTAGRSIRYLTPDCVVKYILNKGLYRGS